MTEYDQKDECSNEQLLDQKPMYIASDTPALATPIATPTYIECLESNGTETS